MARPATILLLLASSAHGQVQAPDKAYIEQIPRGVLRPSIPAPVMAPQAGARPVAAPSNRAAPAAPPATAAAAARPATVTPPPVARPQPQAQAQAQPPVRPMPSPQAAPASVVVARSAGAGPPGAARPLAVPQTASGVCLIRAGTFSQRANADSLAKALKPLGDVRVNAMQLGGKPVHLVTIAGLGTRKNAETTMARLKASGRDLGALSISGCRT